MTNKTSEVKFIDGAVSSRTSCVIAARPLALGDYDERSGTRMFLFLDGQWYCEDVNYDVTAVCISSLPSRIVFYIGRSGEIGVNQKGSRSEEQVPDAGLAGYGYLMEGRNIAGSVYVCGESGQIYRREAERWIHFDEGPLHRAEPLQRRAIMSIDGVSEREIYAVGEDGQIWHFDGLAWVRTPSPTTVHLNAVRCVSPDRFFTCGDDGTLLEWNNGWKRIEIPKQAGDPGFLEYFNDTLYIACHRGLFEYDGIAVKQTLTGLKPPPVPKAMDANDGVMWCFSDRHLCFYDGDKWTYVKHPDNPE